MTDTTPAPQPTEDIDRDTALVELMTENSRLRALLEQNGIEHEQIGAGEE